MELAHNLFIVAAVVSTVGWTAYFLWSERRK